MSEEPNPGPEPAPEDATRNLIQSHFRQGDYLGMFEAVYAQAAKGQGRIPWGDRAPSPLLVSWAEASALNVSGRQALVVGCGLGDDAEYLAGLGYAVLAFDVAPSAIAECRQRFHDSTVDYQQADLFALPEDWAGRFDLIVESRTLQALPWQLCAPGIAAITRCVRPGGEVLVLCLGRDPQDDRHGIPWPLSRVELAEFEAQGLQEISFEDFAESRARRRFRVLYHKPEA